LGGSVHPDNNTFIPLEAGGEVPMRLSDQQFEQICRAVMGSASIGLFGRLLDSDDREFPPFNEDARREFKDGLIRVLLQESRRRELTEIADYLATHWEDDDSPQGEYASSSSPLFHLTPAVR
jgi:hypothetical protein